VFLSVHRLLILPANKSPAVVIQHDGAPRIPVRHPTAAPRYPLYRERHRDAVSRHQFGYRECDPIRFMGAGYRAVVGQGLYYMVAHQLVEPAGVVVLHVRPEGSRVDAAIQAHCWLQHRVEAPQRVGQRHQHDLIGLLTFAFRQWLPYDVQWLPLNVTGGRRGTTREAG